jgi:hypothetical protein
MNWSPSRETSIETAPSSLSTSCPAVSSMVSTSAMKLASTSGDTFGSGFPLTTIDSTCSWT